MRCLDLVCSYFVGGIRTCRPLGCSLAVPGYLMASSFLQLRCRIMVSAEIDLLRIDAAEVAMAPLPILM